MTPHRKRGKKPDAPHSAPAADALPAAADGLASKLAGTSPNDVHAHVIELKVRSRLSPALMLAMAERGASAFLESALAIRAGLPLLDVRDMLAHASRNRTRILLRTAGIDDALMLPFMQVIGRLYGGRATGPMLERDLYLA